MKYIIRYRIEARKINNSRKVGYYLIREFNIEKKKCVIAKYIKAESYPDADEISRFLGNNIYDIEEKAQEKYLETRLNALKTEYLKPETASDIERMRYLSNYLNNLLPEDEIHCYDEKSEYQYIHGTTAIEGNTLTLGETEDLLEHGILPEKKTAREIFEIQNFKEVVKYRNKYTGKITLTFIKKIHKILMTHILSDPGEFRTSDNILISGYDYQVTPALLIEDELNDLVSWYYRKITEKSNPFECAVIFHYRFETIHPFVDGNGRVGRELLNYLLSKSGYPRLIIPVENRNKYLSALHYGNNDDFMSMMNSFSELMLKEKLKILESDFRQQIEIRIKGSSKKKSKYNLSEFFT